MLLHLVGVACVIHRQSMNLVPFSKSGNQMLGYASKPRFYTIVSTEKNFSH
jgi:hypothetical protein